MIVGIDLSGTVTYNLQTGSRRSVTKPGAVRPNRKLYVTSLGADGVGAIDAP